MCRRPTRSRQESECREDVVKRRRSWLSWTTARRVLPTFAFIFVPDSCSASARKAKGNFSGSFVREAGALVQGLHKIKTQVTFGQHRLATALTVLSRHSAVQRPTVPSGAGRARPLPIGGSRPNCFSSTELHALGDGACVQSPERVSLDGGD